MPGPRSMRLVESALRCYPQRWRSRHGDEAAEIASLLIRDGTPARSVAWSYLMGAVRTRLVTGPRRRLGAAVGALLLAAGSLGVPLALLSSPAPANAASVTHSRPAHPHPAHPHPADPWHGGSRPADPRYAGVRSGAPDRCDRHDHC
jgi:DNA-binding IclR family transcriptional regulator